MIRLTGHSCILSRWHFVRSRAVLVFLLHIPIRRIPIGGLQLSSLLSKDLSSAGNVVALLWCSAASEPSGTVDWLHAAATTTTGMNETDSKSDAEDSQKDDHQ